MKKRVLALIAVICLFGCMFSGCGSAQTVIKVGVLSGPTGIGAVEMMKQSEEGKSKGNYSFELVAQPTDIVSKLASGDLDIAAVPTNLTANLYNKTNGKVQMLAINTLGVLYVLENTHGGEPTIHSVGDLTGKTVYTTGQGSNPEFTLNYLLRSNGLEPGEDLTVEYLDSAEVASKMASGDIDICMLPCPASTAVMVKNADVQMVIDVNEAWTEVADNGSRLTMGSFAVRKEFAEKNPQAIQTFLDEYQVSVDFATQQTEEAAELVAQYGITQTPEIAAKALPDCGLVCITGKDMQPTIENYFRVLFEADPASLGGNLPGEDFYYTGK